MAKKKKIILKAENVITNIKKDFPDIFKGYYNPVDVMEKNTSYKMIISKRSDGKTYAYRTLIYYAFQKFGYTSVIIRRLDSSIKTSMIKNDFTKIFENYPSMNIKKYDGIYCYSGAIGGFWYSDDGKKKIKDDPFCEYLAISTAETTKSSKDYSSLFLVLFDEFLSRTTYLPNEFLSFTNLLSTIIRETVDCNVVMLGNPVSWVSPYFNEYGIKPLELIENTITIFKSGKSQTSIAVEYVGEKNGNKKIDTVNDRFFGFENNRIKSITSGIWETPMYPRLKKQNDETVITDKIFIRTDNINVRMSICKTENIGYFIRCYQFFDDSFYDDDIILDVSEKPIISKNVYTKISSVTPVTPIFNLMLHLYLQQKYFYSDNTIGETVRVFLQDFTHKSPKQFE